MTTFTRSDHTYRRVEVPVVAVFTKFDGLVTTAFNDLREVHGMSRSEATKNMVKAAEDMLNENFIIPLTETKFRPSGHVRLDG